MVSRCLTIVGGLLVACAVVVGCGLAAAYGETKRDFNARPSVLRLDWRSGTNDAFTTLECPHPDTQFHIVRRPSRHGGHAARFTIHTGDVWSNGSVRCLDANYSTNESAGQTFYFGLSVYVPRPGLSNNLIWELHQPISLYSVESCGLAPYALFVHGGRLMFRISTGNCVPGDGNRHRELNIPVPRINPFPKRRWLDFVIRISFAEAHGSIYLWARRSGEEWSNKPLISRRDIPTMPFCDSCHVHNVKLYTTMGLYPGGPYSGTDTVYLDAYKRGPTFDSVAP